MTISLTEGDELPSIGLRATDGYLLNLRSFVTKRPALLAFFGAPTLKGSARQRGMKVVNAITAGHRRLTEAGIAVAGITTDSENQQSEFARAHELPFLLLCDERRSAVALLGIELVADGANMNVARPIGLVVDRDGTLRAVLDPLVADTLVDDVVQALAERLPAATQDASPAG